MSRWNSEKPAAEDVEVRLRALLAGGPRASRDVKRELIGQGVASSTIDRVRADLEAQGKLLIKRHGRTTDWGLVPWA